MQRMFGFRNVAIHEYTHLNLEVINSIITKQLGDFRTLLRKNRGVDKINVLIRRELDYRARGNASRFGS